MHPSIHPYLHTYIHAYIHTYLHPSMHPSIHPSIHTYIHTYICACANPIHILCIQLKAHCIYLLQIYTRTYIPPLLVQSTPPFINLCTCEICSYLPTKPIFDGRTPWFAVKKTSEIHWSKASHGSRSPKSSDLAQAMTHFGGIKSASLSHAEQILAGAGNGGTSKNQGTKR